MSTPQLRAAHDRSPVPLVIRRRSTIHGSGVFAARTIRKGTRILEYIGERMSHAEADERQGDEPGPGNVTYLFTVNAREVIDGALNGGVASFVNHGCEPNCVAHIEDGRIFIFALRTLQPGEELLYDYQLRTGETRKKVLEAAYACRCGAATCRGTMLYIPRKRAAKKAAKKATKKVARGSKREAAERAPRTPVKKSGARRADSAATGAKRAGAKGAGAKGAGARRSKQA